MATSKCWTVLMTTCLFSWVLFLFLIYLHATQHLWTSSRLTSSDNCFVKSSTGHLRGRKVNVNGKSVCEFLGIPYAHPPIGDLRFAKPMPISEWKGVLNASRYKPSCLQSFPQWAYYMMTPTSLDMNENCLYLNIWVDERFLGSSNDGPQKKDTKPVLFWIHGGGFQFGSGTLEETNGTTLTSLHEVVVVTINYRLNAFGFLNLENDHIPGNMGLYDQAMALKWVRDNAALFGGDKEKITLWGQGMGGMSVSAHLISPLTRNWINRAIIQTGSIFTPPTMYSKFGNVADRMISQLGCDSFLDDELNHCLKAAPAGTILEAINVINNKNPISFMFSPDEGFFNDSSPTQIRTDLGSQFSSTCREVMVGFNSDEGSLLLHSLLPSIFPATRAPNVTRADEAKDILRGLFVEKFEAQKSIIQSGLDFDFKNNMTQPQLLRSMIDFVGNNIFVCPTILYGEEISMKHNETKVFMFSNEGRTRYNRLHPWFGTIHNEEVPMMFGYPFRKEKTFTEHEKAFSSQMMKMVVSFVTNGFGKFKGSSWPPFSAQDPRYLQLNARHEGSIRSGIHHKSCSLYKLVVDIS